MKELTALVRHNLQLLANSAPTPPPLHPAAERAIEAFATGRKLRRDAVMLTAGNTSPIDLLLRTFCSPGRDNIVVSCPTVADYARLAHVNDVECRGVALDTDFRLEARRLLSATGVETKLLFIAAPSYPVGCMPKRSEVLRLCDNFGGIIVVDETFADFSRTPSYVTEIARHPHLVVIGNFSAAFHLADVEVGYTIAQPAIIQYLSCSAPLYPLSTPTSETLTEWLTRRRLDVDKRVRWILDEREKMTHALQQLSLCRKIYPSSANYLLIRVDHAAELQAYLAERHITVTNCSDYPLCDNCLCLPIGLTAENNALLSALRTL
jgi:histidinol-phosphate aminotransferase